MINKEELREIILGIRQAMCNTEFAPEPFTKPLDIDKLVADTEVKLLSLLSQEEEAIRADERERIKGLLNCNHYKGKAFYHSVPICDECLQALKESKGE